MGLGNFQLRKLALAQAAGVDDWQDLARLTDVLDEGAVMAVAMDVADHAVLVGQQQFAQTFDSTVIGRHINSISVIVHILCRRTTLRPLMRHKNHLGLLIDFGLRLFPELGQVGTELLVVGVLVWKWVPAFFQGCVEAFLNEVLRRSTKADDDEVILQPHHVHVYVGVRVGAEHRLFGVAATEELDGVVVSWDIYQLFCQGLDVNFEKIFQIGERRLRLHGISHLRFVG